MSRRRSKSKSPDTRNRTDSDDPSDLERRIFVGNLPTNHMSRKEMEELFSKYGKISALSMFRGFGFVQYERKEEADAAVEGEKGRMYKGYRLDINKAAERRNMAKAPSRSSPSRRDLYPFGESREVRRDRSPLRTSPRRDGRDSRDVRDARTLRDTRDVREPRDIREARDLRDARDGREARDPRDFRDPRDARDLRDYRDPRDLRDARDIRDPRDLRDARAIRDTRDSRDLRDPLYDRYRDVRDPLYRRDDPLDKYRLDELYRKKEDSLTDRYRDPLDRPRDPEDRLKREERRREELYRQYFDEIQRRVDAERAVDCSVVVVNKQSKEYAESLGRKVRDLGMMVDLIFLNTEVSLTQALEDVTRGGSPFAIVVTQQHQVHRSCTVNILFGTPQEHRNMPIADAMVLVARNYERFKTETREKEREDIARQAAKMSAEAILRERALQLEDGVRGPHPPGIQTLLGLLADNRYVTAEEMDKVILYLRDRKERMLSVTSDPLQSQLSRQTMGAAPVTSLDGQSSLASNQPLQLSQPVSSTPAAQSVSTPQQELQAKILSLFNSGSGAATANTNSASSAGVTGGAAGQSYGNMGNNQQRPGQMNPSSLVASQQRSQPAVNQMANSMVPGALQGAARNAAPRPGLPSQPQGGFGQHQNRPQVPSNVPNQRQPGSTGINFDNPSVQKALDTLIQSGPALSHLVNQTAGQAGRGVPQQQSILGAYPRHY